MNAVELLAEIIREQTPEDIWQDSPLIGYRMLGNTNRGEVGEEFIRRFLARHGIQTGNGGRMSETDIRIAGRRFEVKTASLGATSTFQFNHVRLDRQYGFLLCVGICPNRVVFDMWRKGAVAEYRAGILVRMAEGQAVTYKLAKKLDDLRAIEDCRRPSGPRSPGTRNPDMADRLRRKPRCMAELANPTQQPAKAEMLGSPVPRGVE